MGTLGKCMDAKGNAMWKIPGTCLGGSGGQLLISVFAVQGNLYEQLFEP